MEAKDNKAIEQLQEYVEANSIAADNLEIYRGDRLLYSSVDTGTEGGSILSLGEEYWDFDDFYTLEFADGEAEVYLYGNHRHKVYQGVQVLEFAISFLAFIVIFLIGIHRIIRYICKLRDEIEILEGGNLDYEITVQGKNELAELASSLNSMRSSFSEQIKTEIRLRKENKELVTEVSHDIRMPLTVLLLYTEALRHKDQQQMEQYIERIDDKAKQIQKLADSIFEYSLKEKQAEAKTSDTFKNVFFGIMSEMIEYLGEQDTVRLSFSNSIQENISQTGTKIGIKNITSMMESMEGECRINQAEEEFKLTLVFPLRHA